MSDVNIREKLAGKIQAGTKVMKKTLVLLLTIAMLIGIGFVFIKYYSVIFSRHVTGVISNVQKPSSSMAIMGGRESNLVDRQLFSFAVAIRIPSGEIVTASTEDRQWAVAEVGKCVEARFYPFPFWDFEKYGTYFGAKLLKMYECPKELQDSENKSSAQEHQE